ncbi:transketolase [Aggregatilinea lenta]|uniref:transketolase n=1 Tax=Aggregatilinea lenta TaxID=913108 RepID=UPI000E5B45FC|nr:transketolase [Aggregatilinea lenta]
MYFHPDSQIIELQERARDLRLDSVEMIYRRQAGHPGGSLSAADIVAALFFHKMRIDPHNPEWPERDRFIMSKGHASALLYAALAQCGYFPREDLQHWGELDCHLQGHPDRLKTPGVEMTAGLLGHGVAIGIGIALTARMDGRPFHTYVLMGDGECQGGIVWEGAMVAAKYRLANLTAIVDYNDVQLDGAVHDILPLEPLVDKWRACNWAVIEINGHDMRQILQALDTADEIHDRPTMIIARTTKGKGVSYMENKSYWHGVAPNDAQLAQAVAEIKGAGRHG